MKLPGTRPSERSLRPWGENTKFDWHFSGMVAVCLLPLLFAGCSHKPQPEPLAPPIEDAPPPKPAPSPAHLPPAIISVPSIPNEVLEPKPTEPAQPAPAPPVKQKKRTPPSTTPQPIARPSVSAIGQLSSGDPSDLQRQTADSLIATERGLNAINRSLSEPEKKTASHIREFLKLAHAALSSGDIDGAHTLAVKAKVLLGELSQ